MSRKKRRIAQDEHLLWQAVAKTVTPLRRSTPEGNLGDRFDRNDRPKEFISLHLTAPPLSQKAGAPSQKEKSDSILAPYSRVQPARTGATKMDAKLYGKMQRGKLRPQAKLDLHGMNLSQAQREVGCFIARAHETGFRLVLVITGKGKTTPRNNNTSFEKPSGRLRHQLPYWLSLPPLSAFVLEVSHAHFRHGGEGAYYVYLRRAK